MIFVFWAAVGARVNDWTKVFSSTAAFAAFTQFGKLARKKPLRKSRFFAENFFLFFQNPFSKRTNRRRSATLQTVAWARTTWGLSLRRKVRLLCNTGARTKICTSMPTNQRSTRLDGHSLCAISTHWELLASGTKRTSCSQVHTRLFVSTFYVAGVCNRNSDGNMPLHLLARCTEHVEIVNIDKSIKTGKQRMEASHKYA